MKARLVLAAGWACAAAFAQPLAPTTDYVVQIQGVKAGAMTVTRGADGQHGVVFSYRDNGRGPDIDETFRIADPAMQRADRYAVTGKSTFGGEIREQVTFADGRVRWTSVVDSGDEAAAANAVFVPLESSPASWGQLVRTVLAQPGQTAPAVGGATLKVERLAQALAPGPLGTTAPVALYALTGVDSEPWYVWLRDDASREYFASVWPGWQITPAGFEASGATLLERQRVAQNDRLRAIRQRSAEPLPGLTLIEGVRWFDAKAATMRGPSDVYLSDGRIALITPPGSVRARPLQVISGRDRTLLPGLWDMHGHLWSGDALLHVAGGVTSVRDMANQNAELDQLRGEIDSGLIVGPRIVPAGFIEGRSPFSSRNGVVADDLNAALQAVDAYAARGYRQIKLYNSIRPEWVKPLATRAHAHGMTVAGHVPAFMRAEAAVRAGYDELTHINQVMLNFFVRPEQDTRTLLRFTLVGDQARHVAPDSVEAKRFIALLRRHGTAVDPTLATFEAQFSQRDGEPNPSLDAIADHLPVVMRRSLRKSEMSPSVQKVAEYRASYARMLQFVGAMHRAGVPLVAGTDHIAGLMLHRELELYVKAGIPAREALRIATWNGARIAGHGADSGSIERGKVADLVLIDGDPSRNIGDIRRASLVIQGRVAYAPERLYQAMGIKPFAPAATIERNTVTP